MQAVALSAFGLDLRTDLQPPGAWRSRPPGDRALSIGLVTAEAVASAWSGFEAVGWEGFIDGARFVAQRGRGGDHRFIHGEEPRPDGLPTPGTRAIHHLSADARSLCCAPAEPSDRSWWRVVLDSVLFTIALLGGREALHAGAIEGSHGAVAITAAAGGGKSTLISELLSRGTTLVSDDVLIVDDRPTGPPMVFPGPPLMTVPADTLAASPSDEEICRLGEERWLAVPVLSEPTPLTTLVVLDRRPRAQLSEPGVSLREIESPLASLLSGLMRYPSTSERERARFELAARLAEEVRMLRLAASLDTPPADLADALTSAL